MTAPIAAFYLTTSDSTCPPSILSIGSYGGPGEWREGTLTAITEIPQF